MTDLRHGLSAGDTPDSGDDRRSFSSLLLPNVVHEASAAVLIVETTVGSVTFANELARQLAPGQRLPMPIDEWSLAAGLEDASGDNLPHGGAAAASVDSPAESLLRIARGQPVTGEAVTAARSTSATGVRETLWVLGLPLTDAPEPVSSHALVVFLPARNAQLVAGAQESAMTVRDRAVLATRMSFTITDPNLPDGPLIWVNPAFTETTGYSFEDAVGRNCRFLQGPHTDRAAVADIAESIRDGRPLTTTLLNYRPDGSTFWNELSISPVQDESGHITHFVGVQADVTARVEAQQSRDGALSQVAKAADRLALLADFTSRMAMGQAPHQIVEMLGAVLVPRVGTLCAVVLVDENGRVVDPYVVHENPDPAMSAQLDELRERLAAELDIDGPIARVLLGQTRDIVVSRYTSDPLDAAEPVVSLRELLADGLSLQSMIVVPLLARRGILGAVVIMTDGARAALGDADLALIRDLAVRAGLMLENTQLYAREQATAAALQRSLLPRLPRIPGLEIAASYVPAADEAAVGGDWYDVFSLRPEGDHASAIGVAVGDVMGHNYDSAARMGKLSTIVRAYGWPGSEPYTVLTAVDELLAGGGLDYMATCFYGTLTLRANGATLRYSSAGHPPAILRRPGGSAVTLDDGRGPMIGISTLMPTGSTRPHDAALDLASGSTLICFTDGLTDGYADEPDLDAGLAELIRVADALPTDASPGAIVDALTSGARRHDDDVAVVAIRIL